MVADRTTKATEEIASSIQAIQSETTQAVAKMDTGTKQVEVGVEQSQHNKDSRIIVVELLGKVVGFTVDRVNEVLRISEQIVEPPPAAACGQSADYVQGVGKLKDRLLLLLDLNRVFNQDELTRIAQTAKAA